MCDIRLFRRAYLDYRAAENLLKTPENDEAYMNMAAYHLQQAVEKTLEAFLLGSAVKEKLESLFPKAYRPASDFEWNCMYQVFRRKLSKNRQF